MNESILLMKSGTAHSIFPENFGNTILLFLELHCTNTRVLAKILMTSSQNCVKKNLKDSRECWTCFIVLQERGKFCRKNFRPIFFYVKLIFGLRSENNFKTTWYSWQNIDNNLGFAVFFFTELLKLQQLIFIHSRCLKFWQL